MKTLQDCKDKVARREDFRDWEHLLSVCGMRSTYVPLHQSAELYGRYCRFVEHYQGKQHYNAEMEGENTKLLMALAQIKSYADRQNIDREALRIKIEKVCLEVANRPHFDTQKMKLSGSGTMAAEMKATIVDKN